MRYVLLSLLFIMPLRQLSAQHVVASCGTRYNTNSGSVSFTIGQPIIPTLTNGNHKMTQGFHQPFHLELNLKAYLQGFYDSISGQMTDALFNQGEYNTASVVADTITIELHSATAPYTLAYSAKTILLQNGMARIKGYGHLGQSYYVVVKHRNHVETWSAAPVKLKVNTLYNFTTSDNKAYGNNQVEVENGIYAFYSGDMNQDGAIDAFDYVVIDPDISNGSSGYLTTDLNGDGSVDAFDYVILDPNIYAGVGASAP